MEETDVQKTPGWVKDLEKKRQRPHKLAHEIGAGAPCLACGDACPGLDLHFWRKSCRNCKCGKEKHDVVDDQNYQQFEILLGTGHQKTLKKTYQLNIGGDEKSKGDALAVSFDWVPPGISPDVAEGYMMGLPEDQRPVSGSAAAQKRREQLERQVPIHDIDPSHCHSLTDAEILGFENYRQHLKEGAVGQGRVATLAAMLKELRLPYAIESQHASSGNVQHAMNAQHTTNVQRSNLGQQAHSLNIKQAQAINTNNNDECFPPPPSPQTLSMLQPPDFPPPPLPTSLPPFMQRPSAFLPKPFQPGTGITSSDLNKNLPPNQTSPNNDDLNNQNIQPGQEIFNKSTVGQVQGNQMPMFNPETGRFDITEQNTIPGTKTAQLAPNSSLNPQNQDSATYYETPISYNPESGEQQDDFNKLGGQVNFTPNRNQLGLNFPAPMPMIEEVKSPGYEGEMSGPVRAARYDNNNAAGELPGQLAGLQLTDPSSKTTCARCTLPVAPGDVVVTADRAGPGVFWHPACFVCSSCKELLVDLIYFHKDNKLFCGRHFAEEVNIPRCAACDELIFTTEYTLAEEQHFHVRHFCCIECDVPLAGMKYISRDGQPCCLDCYQKLHSKACQACRKLIGPSETSVIWQHLHWHADPKCFKCVICQTNLLNNKFAVRDENSLCSKACIQAFLAQRSTAL